MDKIHSYPGASEYLNSLGDADTTVACVGTQHTFGMSYPDGNYDYDQTWPGQLAELTGHNCLNFGVTGSSIQPFAERILKIKELYEPDAYVLEVPMHEKITLSYELEDEINKDDQFFSHTRVLGKDFTLGQSGKLFRCNFGAGEFNSEEDMQYAVDEKFTRIAEKWKDREIDTLPFNLDDLISWGKVFAWQTRRNFWQVRYTQEIFSIQCIMENIGKPFLMFQWNYNTFKSPFVELLKKEHWLNQSWSGNLKKSLRQKPEVWADQQHLNPKGMKYIAEMIYADYPRIMAGK